MSQTKAFSYFKNTKKDKLEILICKDSSEAEFLKDVALFFGKNVVVFPDFRAAFGDDLRVFKDELHELLTALYSYHKAKNKPLVISPLKTLLFRLPKKELFDSVVLEFGSTINMEKFKKQLLFWGYSFVDIIQLKGEISFRGDIVDIYPPNAKYPFRISFFDDEIEQIKYFDIQTQKTIDNELESIEIIPAFFALSEAMYDEIETKVLQSDYEPLIKDIASLGFWYLDDFGENFLENKIAKKTSSMDDLLQDAYALNAPTVDKSYFDVEILEQELDIKELIVSNVKMLIEAHKTKQITIIAANDAIVKQAGIYDTSGLHVEYKPYILNIITKDELVISLNKKEKKRRKRKTSLLLDDLKPGDYVVHEDYGVGVFEKIEQTQILGGVKDFISIRYMGDDRVLLPVENLDSIDRYIAAGGTTPTLDKLGKGSFAKLKESVRKKLFEIASQIVGTAAKRALIKAPKILVDTHKIYEFQNMVEWEYTQDQTKVIKNILDDLASGRIMDRLLSGDVGFGKTEVALNAIYATYLAGFQSAFVVPTTLLSAQHFRSLDERFASLGIRYAKLDRFVSAKEKNNIKKSLADGTLDVVVGTHALFSLEFKKLGLVVVDEEHKFGVKQKEKIKTLYHNVHMLSMSATPIPRSLNQALSSIKTISELLTPPSQRQGVRTFVKEYDDKLIKEVILREIRRGGQIFYVHNSIEHMPIKYGELKALLPDARVVMLHSKISAIESEKEILKFENGEYDVMLATSIIESGIHMPRVNTIIVDGADRFGMADLHQLRGRVGRGNVEGFAYLIINDKSHITDEAKKRLLALESNSFLGSGSALAYHDLEIRGGGNLVGDAQSGHIKNIGYSLYLRMLEDAIKELSNKTDTPKAKIDIKLSISAYISSDIVAQDRLRLDIYRRLSNCEEVSEIYEIQDEVIDRFGELDIPTLQFFELMSIKLLGIKNKIKSISNYAQNITFTFKNDEKQTIKAQSKDDDDIIKAVLIYLRRELEKK